MNKLPNQWQLQEAKNKLSQLVKNADKGVPQYITITCSNNHLKHSLDKLGKTYKLQKELLKKSMNHIE